jgi:indole-3-glycerol phosphate synthase
MVSVLCDTPFFGGGWKDVADVRAALDNAGYAVPVLAKEFVLDERQLDEAVACGADAVLLIARIVQPSRLCALATHAMRLGLEPIVEVVSDDELAQALDTPTRIVGVNARDLDTLVMDATRAARVLAQIPSRMIPLYLSGIRGANDVRAIAQTGAHGALVGETLMREADPLRLLAELVEAARM